MPRYSLAQVDAELKKATDRRQEDLDLIHRALLDIAAMDYRIEQFLEARAELQPGRHRAPTT